MDILKYKLKKDIISKMELNEEDKLEKWVKIDQAYAPSFKDYYKEKIEQIKNNVNKYSTKEIEIKSVLSLR